MSASRDLLARLVAFDTTSRESNLALIDFVSDYLAGYGVASELIYNEAKSKANLFASIGPVDVPGIVLSGHTDVVPVDGQAWTHAPFQLSEEGGRLYGRGTADMKGYIACVLALVPALVGAPLRLPVHIALSYDEEVGCLGVRSLLDALKRKPVKPMLCVIGEPTELKPVLGHKGKLAMRCDVQGLACHSAHAPSGVNAIEYAARLIAELGRLGNALRVPDACNERFDPPFSTVQVGVIDGGTALNIVPQHCRFDFEVRSLPAQEPRQLTQALRHYAEHTLLPAMQAVDGRSEIRFSELSSYPGLDVSQTSEAARLIAQFCGSRDFSTVAFGTEGGLFDQAGIATVVCGPGSMEQGHKPDEFVSTAQLAGCDEMLGRVVAFACA